MGGQEESFHLCPGKLTLDMYISMSVCDVGG